MGPPTRAPKTVVGLGYGDAYDEQSQGSARSVGHDAPRCDRNLFLFFLFIVCLFLRSPIFAYCQRKARRACLGFVSRGRKRPKEKRVEGKVVEIEVREKVLGSTGEERKNLDPQSFFSPWRARTHAYDERSPQRWAGPADGGKRRRGSCGKRRGVRVGRRRPLGKAAHQRARLRARPASPGRAM